MPPKRTASSKPSGSKAKREKKVMSLQEKVALLDLLRDGKSFVAVSRYYQVNESTVCYIKKNEEAIRHSAAASFGSCAKVVTKVRNNIIVRMESALALWISDCSRKNVILDGNIIRQKARSLYDRFAMAGDEPQPSTSTATPAVEEFMASRGWFDRFQKRYNIRNVSLHGEAALADTEAASTYPATFKKIIEEKGFKPEQVYNMDETALFYKKMPSRTFLMKDEAKAPGFKAQKDRVTLIMCGNAAGFMLKPGLIYKAANPRTLKNKNKNLLPVYWMNNPKAWITKSLASDWFHRNFILEARAYLHSLGMEFKVLLMDNAGGHPVDLHYDGVTIEFLPPNTTSLIQPMDQGVIRAFKALYTKNAVQHLVSAMDADENFTLKAYWQKFTIATALQVIGASLKDMKKETLNACWKKLWPEIIPDYEGFSPDEVCHGAVGKAARLMRLLGGEGFDDVTEEEVDNLISAHSNPLTDDDLAELTKSASEEEEEEKEDHEEEKDEGLSLERLSKAARTAAELQDMLSDWDPHMERALKFRNAIDSAMVPYMTLLRNLKKQRRQLPITMFLKPVKKPSQESEGEGDEQPPPEDL